MKVPRYSEDARQGGVGVMVVGLGLAVGVLEEGL